MSNRDKFPGFGEIVDEFRAAFGNVRVRHVINRQTGEELGKPLDGDIVVASPSGKIDRLKGAPRGKVPTRYREDDGGEED